MGDTSQNDSSTKSSTLEFNKRYPLSFYPCNETNNLVTLEYQFKPVIVLDPSQRGNIVVSNETNEAKVQLMNKSDGTEHFKGSIQNTSSISGSSEKTECILQLSNGRFQLHQVASSIVNLRHVRDEQQFSSKKSFDISKGNTIVTNVLNSMKAGGKKRKASTAAINKTINEAENASKKVAEEAKEDASADSLDQLL